MDTLSMDTPNYYITKTQYAESVGVHPGTITKWIDSGNLPPSCVVKMGGKELIDLKKAVEIGIFEQHKSNRNDANSTAAMPLLQFEDTFETAANSPQTETSPQGDSSTNSIPQYVNKSKYAELVGANKATVGRWIDSGSLPKSCIVIQAGKEMIDVQKAIETGAFERHSNHQKKKLRNKVHQTKLEKIELESSPANAASEDKCNALSQETPELKATNESKCNTIKQPESPANPAAAKVLSIMSKITTDSRPNRRNSTNNDEDDDLFNLERRARIQKLQAEAAIADMNQKRAEGKLLDADRFIDLVADLYSSFNSYFDQFSEQSAAALYGQKDLQEMKGILDTRLAAMRERIREEIERKKADAQRLIESQTKPLKL